MGSGASTNQTQESAASAKANGRVNRSTHQPDQDNGGNSSDKKEKQKRSLTSRQAEKLGYPPPVPPTSRKADIFSIKEYSKIDKAAKKKMPDKVLMGSYDDLVTHLTKDLKTELQILRALFIWMTSLDVTSLEKRLPKLPEQGTPCDYLLKIAWKMGNHAYFFAQLARAAGLRCTVVTGINKSAAYLLGQPMNKKGMTAQWNAVLIDDQWRLLDVYWSSTVLVGKKTKDWTLVAEEATEADSDQEEEGESIHASNDFFFIPDPDQFVPTHFPDDPAWQLLEHPMPEGEFESMVYIRERFYDLKLVKLPESHPKHFLKTVKGQIFIKFGLDPQQSKSCQFRYLIFRNRQETDKISKTAFEKFVYYEKTDEEISYAATFPVAGLFKLDVFGQNKKRHDTMDLVCSYLIKCDDPQKVQPLPINPEIGWGAGAEAEEKGIIAKTHDTGTITTEDGRVEIRFELEKKLSVLQSLKNNYLDDWLLNRFAIIRTEGKELVLNIRLPTEGEYALEMFADKENTKGELPNVCNYLIKCPKLTNKPPPFPKLHEGILGKSSNADDWGIRAISHPGDTITTKEPALLCEFECDNPDVEIFCELEHNIISNEQLSKAVTKETKGNKTGFKLDIPKAGEFGLNVYARKKGQTDIRHIHSYLLESTQTEQTKTETKSPPNVVPIITNKPNVKVEVASTIGDLKAELSRKNAKTDPSANQCKSSFDGKKVTFDVTLPADGQGEYKLDVYGGGKKDGLKHDTEFQIIYDKSYKEPVKEEDNEINKEEMQKMKQEKALAAKHKLQRDKLKAAVASKNIGVIQAAIHDFEKSETPDPAGDLDKAKQNLLLLKLTQILSSAMANRNLKQLQDTVAAIEKRGFTKQLHLQVSMANRIIEQLLRLEKMRHAIMDLNQPTIAEIKSYSTPPEVVHKVMTATFVLLGEREKHLRNWKSCVVLIGKTGKESLKRRVTTLKVETVPIEVAEKAKDVLRKINLDEVRDVSSGAATFYVWTTGMIEECESREMA